MRLPSISRCGAPEALLALVLLTGAVRASPTQSRQMAEAKSWAYQLVGAQPAEIAGSDYDVVVVDYGLARKGADAAPDSGVLDRLRRTPSGARRLVLAYFSIGEAESYRSYWQSAWRTARPDWIGTENPEWPNNFNVRYWRPEWRAILFGRPEAYLDRILAAGFDGVYLDGVDKYDVWQGEFPSAKADMIDLVARIAAYGRERHKGFLVVPQNADELLEDPHYLAMIDGIGREELLYGEKAPGSRNDRKSIEASLGHLRRLQRAGKPVFVVEYLQQRERADSALHELKRLGFLGYIANRDLNRLTSPATDWPATDCAPPGCSR